MRKHATNALAVECLIKLMKNSRALIHLDLSGMFLGDKFITKIVIEGVAPSRSIAAFHFEGNKVSEDAKRKIYKIFRHPPYRDTSSNLVMPEQSYLSETEDEPQAIQKQVTLSKN